MSTDQSLYCYGTSTAMSKAGIKHHSGILSGSPVLFAGEIAVKNGILQVITMRSGHYMPEEKHLRKFLQLLENKGVDLQSVVLKGGSYWGKIISNNAADYLSSQPSSKNRFFPKNYSQDDSKCCLLDDSMHSQKNGLHQSGSLKD